MLNRIIAIIILSLVCNYHLEAQNLENILLRNKNTTVEAFSLSENYTHELHKEIPLVSFEVDDVLHNSSESEGKIHLEITPAKEFNLGYKAEIKFINTSNDTIQLSNVVPLGKNNKVAYITGLGDHRLSRTYLFLPNKQPVNCIVPDNAWELGYSGTKLNEELSVCALIRRDVKSLIKAKRKRFSTIIEPGGSVKYNFYADTYKGEWQEGLKKIFQERYLYDVVNFDNSLFEREDLQWIRHDYIIHLMMSWDKSFYDAEKGYSSLDAFLQRGKELYGGDDAIGTWPTWPSLGIDQRNQFDLYRDLPGGLPTIKKTVEKFREKGTLFFIAYNPWDKSTRVETHLNGMADILKATGADGVILDTRGESSRELQEAADKVKEGIVMYSEGMAVPKNMQGIVSGRVHNALYYPPLFNLNKFIKPEFAIFRVAELYKERIQREFAVAFFNGYGTELNIFAPGQPSWVEEQYKYLGKTTRILREHTFNFTSNNYIPLISTLQDQVYVNKWPLGNKTIYTIFSLIPEGFKELLFEVETDDNTHFVDLWHHKELVPILKDNKYFIEAETDAFNKSYLGTNNEGEVDCIAKFPKILSTHLNSDLLEITANKGDKIKLWAGLPAYDKDALELESGKHTIRLFDKFGKYEGKFIVQLFDKDILIDENIIEIKAGTPRLASSVEKTLEKTNLKGMVKIPAGSFTFHSSNGDQFIPYPDFQKGKEFEMKSFFMDKHPITNAQFDKFLKKSKYQPSDPVNFLKHWENGKIAKGQENFPVVYVSYEDAKAYAKWMNKRLPTEIEWQYAAQTPDERTWPWAKNTGDIYREEEEITGSLTVYKIKGIDPIYCNWGNGQIDPVGTYPKGANPYGLEDLVGSVWQLTNDFYKSGSYNYIIMKGGSYYNPTSSWWYVQGGPRELHYRQQLLRVSQGFERNATVGFRCVAD